MFQHFGPISSSRSKGGRVDGWIQYDRYVVVMAKDGRIRCYGNGRI